MKRYIVFLKQVPASTKVGIDPETKTLKRSSALSQTNPDDLYALQAAVNMRRRNGGEIVAVSMGPASAEAVLYDALQRGADRAILVSSRAFAGSDTFCTGLVLSSVVRKIGDFDILFFGKMAIDGDTAQVGPQVAAELDIPQVTQLVRIGDISEGKIMVTKLAGDVEQNVSIKLPCAIIVGKGNVTLEDPTLSGWRQAQHKEMLHWDENDLELSPTEVGLKASPTRVVSTFVPEQAKEVCWLNSNDDLDKVICEILTPKK